MEYRIGIPETTDQKTANQRMAPRRGFDTLIRQQHNTRLDLAEMPVRKGGQRRQFLTLRAAASSCARLHSQCAAIHAEHYGLRRIRVHNGLAAAVGVIRAEIFAVIRRSLS